MTKQARTHLRVPVLAPPGDPTLYYTGCGLIGRPSHGATYDTDQVTCGNCEKTRAYASFALAQTEQAMEDFYDAN